MNTEALALPTLLQTVIPGLACIYDVHPLTLKMRSGCAACGYSELGLLNAAFIAFSRSYGMLTEGSGLKRRNAFSLRKRESQYKEDARRSRNMARMFLAEPFRPLAGGQEWRDVADGTSMDILELLTEEHHPLRYKLINSDGTPRAHFLIYLGNRIVCRENLQNTTEQGDSETKISTVLAGG